MSQSQRQSYSIIPPTPGAIPGLCEQQKSSQPQSQMGDQEDLLVGLDELMSMSPSVVPTQRQRSLSSTSTSDMGSELSYVYPQSTRVFHSRHSSDDFLESRVDTPAATSTLSLPSPCLQSDCRSTQIHSKTKDLQQQEQQQTDSNKRIHDQVRIRSQAQCDHLKDVDKCLRMSQLPLTAAKQIQVPRSAPLARSTAHRDDDGKAGTSPADTSSLGENENASSPSCSAAAVISNGCTNDTMSCLSATSPSAPVTSPRFTNNTWKVICGVDLAIIAPNSPSEVLPSSIELDFDSRVRILAVLMTQDHHWDDEALATSKSQHPVTIRMDGEDYFTRQHYRMDPLSPGDRQLDITRNPRHAQLLDRVLAITHTDQAAKFFPAVAVAVAEETMALLAWAAGPGALVHERTVRIPYHYPGGGSGTGDGVMRPSYLSRYWQWVHVDGLIASQGLREIEDDHDDRDSIFLRALAQIVAAKGMLLGTEIAGTAIRSLTARQTHLLASSRIATKVNEASHASSHTHGHRNRPLVPVQQPKKESLRPNVPDEEKQGQRADSISSPALITSPLFPIQSSATRFMMPASPMPQVLRAMTSPHQRGLEDHYQYQHKHQHQNQQQPEKQRQHSVGTTSAVVRTHDNHISSSVHNSTAKHDLPFQRGDQATCAITGAGLHDSHNDQVFNRSSHKIDGSIKDKDKTTTQSSEPFLMTPAVPYGAEGNTVPVAPAAGQAPTRGQERPAVSQNQWRQKHMSILLQIMALDPDAMMEIASSSPSSPSAQIVSRSNNTRALTITRLVEQFAIQIKAGGEYSAAKQISTFMPLVTLDDETLGDVRGVKLNQSVLTLIKSLQSEAMALKQVQEHALGGNL